MEESQFDAIIFGTGLVESIAAAALAKRGYKVAHIDTNSYYGADEASLSLEELVKWADAPPSASSRFHRVSRSQNVPSQSRQYSICLQPAVLPSVGPFISSLIASGVSKYSGFKLVECVSVYDHEYATGLGVVRNVPGSKEDIFKSKQISLIDKRRLMRFLTFAAADFDDKKELEGRHDVPFSDFLNEAFSLNEQIAQVIVHALAFCASPREPTYPALLRLQKYLRSGGRYGASPFLIGHYGCIGDLAQGFCRAAAVSSGVYILGRQLTAINHSIPSEDDKDASKSTRRFNYTIDLEDFPDTLSCNLIISPSSYVPASMKDGDAVHIIPQPNDSGSTKEFHSNVASIARCIAIIDQALAVKHVESEVVGMVKEQAPPPEGEADAKVKVEGATSDAEGGEEAKPEKDDSAPKEDTQIPTDVGVVIFPPSSVPGGSSTHAATVLITGEGSLSTPKGKWLVYISLPLQSYPDENTSPSDLLKPYLDALLSLPLDQSKAGPIQPLFTTFYLEISSPSRSSRAQQPAEPAANQRTYLVRPELPFVPIPEVADYATLAAEKTFFEAVAALKSINGVQPCADDEEEDEDGAAGSDEADLFWPPLVVEEEEGAEW